MERDERVIAERFRALLEKAVVRRLAGQRPGALLSGGMDSSSVVTFARRHREGKIFTFAFRCGGESFDESVYARALADAMGTEHAEVPYGEEQALEIERAVAEMDAPFCDVGINVGTWILGRAAAGKVDFVLTGDGGDELWASHPVYAAQRLLAPYERLPIPRSVDRGLRWLGSRFRDSDHKRDLRVVAKRLLPHPDLPRALGPFRWRCYYVPSELLALVATDTARRLAQANPFKSVLDAYEGYDGPDDGISPLSLQRLRHGLELLHEPAAAAALLRHRGALALLRSRAGGVRRLAFPPRRSSRAWSAPSDCSARRWRACCPTSSTIARTSSGIPFP